MINLIAYEAINEAAKALPAMPAFLKTAGAKPEYVFFGGPWTPDKSPNVWVLEITSPMGGKDTWGVNFFPNGSFLTDIKPEGGKNLRFESGGKWKADSASDFMIGRKTIKGVNMAFTYLMSPKETID